MNNIYTQLANILKIAEFTENYTPSADLQISEYMTADCYDIHVMTNNPNNLDFEYDVYYYQPSFNQIVNRIKELDKDAVVWVSDFETYLPEYEVEDYIERYNEELLEEYHEESLEKLQTKYEE